MEHLTEFVFISMGNLTLAHKGCIPYSFEDWCQARHYCSVKDSPCASRTVSIRRPRKRLHTLRARDVLLLHMARVVTIPTKELTKGWTESHPTSPIDQHGRTLARDIIRNLKANLSTIPHHQPRASSPINDNYCVDKLQEGLLARSQPSTPRQTMNKCPKCCLKSACRGQTSKLLANLA